MHRFNDILFVCDEQSSYEQDLSRMNKMIPGLGGADIYDTIGMAEMARIRVPGLFMGNTAKTILNHVAFSALPAKATGFVSLIDTNKSEGKV